MKKLLMLALVSAILPLWAADIDAEVEEKENVLPGAERIRVKQQSKAWPVFFAICEYPDSPDVLGFRFTIPFSTVQDNVTGFDLGLWGRADYFEGFQVNLLRNDVRDSLAGLQLGLYNSAGTCEMVGMQVGLWNEVVSMRGLQVGLVNTASEISGLQVGLINRCDAMYGFQAGLINVIRDADLSFFPVVNIGF